MCPAIQRWQAIYNVVTTLVIKCLERIGDWRGLCKSRINSGAHSLHGRTKTRLRVIAREVGLLWFFSDQSVNSLSVSAGLGLSSGSWFRIDTVSFVKSISSFAIGVDVTFWHAIAIVLHQLSPFGTFSLKVIAATFMATTFPDELGLVLISGARPVPTPLPPHHSSHNCLYSCRIAE